MIQDLYASAVDHVTDQMISYISLFHDLQYLVSISAVDILLVFLVEPVNDTGILRTCTFVRDGICAMRSIFVLTSHHGQCMQDLDDLFIDRELYVCDLRTAPTTGSE